MKYIENSIRNYILRFWPPLLWGVLVVAVITGLKFSIMDPDVWWHLAAGREMVVNKAFLWREVFSHTLPGVEWVNFEWASQVIFFLIFKLFGYWGFLWSQMILGLVAWGLAVWGARACGLRGAVLFVAAILSFKLIQPRLTFRPEIFSLIFFPLTVLIVVKVREKCREGVFIANEKALLAALFFIGVSWINLHAGFIYGLGLLVLLRVGAQFSRENEQFVRFLEKAIVLFFIAFLVNPHGPFVAAVLVDHLFQLKDNMVLISEWNAPRAHLAPFFWVVCAISIILIIFSVINWKRTKWLFVPAAGIFCMWGAVSFRNTYFLGLLFPMLLGDLFANRSWRAEFEPGRIKSGLWVLAALLMFVFVFDYHKFPKSPISWSKLPAKCCEFVERNNIRGRMFNAYSFGGFLEWTFGKDRKIFVDGRYLFQPFLVEMTQLEKGMAASLNKEGWRNFLGRYSVDYAIMDYWGEARKFLSPNVPFPLTFYNGVLPREEWALVFWDDSGMVFLKRVPKFADIIKQHEYHCLRPINFEQMKFLVKNGDLSKKDVRRELDRHAEEAGFSIRRGKLEEYLAPLIKPD